MPVIFALIILFLSPLIPASEAQERPVTCHFAFESLDFLSDDFVHNAGKQTVESRGLSIVEGRFGNAISHGATRGDEDTVSTSGNDLDLFTAVVIDNYFNAEFKNIRFREPCFYGTGRIHPGLGTVAFWVKTPAADGILFEQATSSWGRTEKQLIEIALHGDGSLRAFVEDARYVQHVIESEPVWDSGGWNHVLFMWDRASGLELWLNGERIASSMGSDAWWENQNVGLFHLALPNAVYDEFYTFDRTLTGGEIAGLYRRNVPPAGSSQYTRLDSPAAERLRLAFSTDTSSLPVARADANTALVIRDITPVRIHDEGVQGWWIADGRYECAWPHEYTIFTVIPGDVDFHAEKAQILPPSGASINYLTFEGNLDGVAVTAKDGSNSAAEQTVLQVPVTDGFFYGSMIDGRSDGELTIPFTKEYGVPEYFESEVLKLPLSGDLRLHEFGMFDVYSSPLSPMPGDRLLHLSPEPPVLDYRRYLKALESLLTVRDRNAAGLFKTNPGTANQTIDCSPMTSLNLFSEPVYSKIGIDHVILDLAVTSPSDNNVLLVRLRNPAMPSQIWTHAEVRLEGFTGAPGRLKLALRFDPLFLIGNDRLWIEITATEGLTIHTDGKVESTVILRPVADRFASEKAYSFKALRPNILTWSRMFEFIPWDYGYPLPDIDEPVCFGGPFDTAYPWQAVLRIDPCDRIANIYKAFGTNEFSRGRYPTDLDSVKPRRFPAPENAPEWAVCFRAFQSFRYDIIDWWRYHQRSDGQVGGGWNDDTLIFGWRYSYGDLPLDGNREALALYNNVFDGFDRTGYFRDGFCRVRPIDQLHNGDFVRNRSKSLIYNLGDPRSAVWAMEEAWHWGKPDRTPYNYGDGSAFLFGKNVLEWYWNKRRVEEPYKPKDRKTLIDQLKQAAYVHNDTTFWRYTDAWCHTDDQYPLGGTIMFDVVNGGIGEIFTRYDQNPRGDDTMAVFSVGVGWPEGGGPDLARLVEYSGNNRLTVSMYSFDTLDRPVTIRLYRLLPGEYTFVLRADSDGDGVFQTSVYERTLSIRRFDTLSFDVPPQVPVILDIRQKMAYPLPGDLPDLAVSDYYVRRDGSDIVATVYNIGIAPTGSFEAALFDAEGERITSQQVESIPGSGDFVPKPVELRFRGIDRTGAFRLVIDPDDDVEEIYEGNNVADINNLEN